LPLLVFFTRRGRVLSWLWLFARDAAGFTLHLLPEKSVEVKHGALNFDRAKPQLCPCF
jgi:hypothetical protein